MRHIKVKFSENEDTGKIILKEDKIIVEASNNRTKEFLEELLEQWKQREKLDDKKLFEIIPEITAHYSRMFFSNIIEKEVEVMPDKERSEKELEQRRISDQSFKIWNPDGTLFAEMIEGKWIKKPEVLKEEAK